MKQRKRGFTLIELLVVISIISLLSSVILAGLSNARVKARDVKRIQDLKQIQIALEMYRDDNGGYPNTTAWVLSNSNWDTLKNFLVPKYISKLPTDPINNTGGNSPWGGTDDVYSYAYMSGNSTPGYSNCLNNNCYDLVARLEDKNNPYRNEIKKYKMFADSLYWGQGSGENNANQIYSPQN